MRCSRVAVFVALGASAGCSTTPLPEDVTGRATYEIVHKIRCEARSAIQSKAIAFMLGEKSPEFVKSEGRRLKGNRAAFFHYDYKKLPKDYVALFDSYADTALAYEFKFDITESSSNTSTLNFKGPIGLEVFSLGWVSGGDLTRANVRTLKLADKFGDLALKMSEDECSNETRNTNFIYPITGDVGILERVDTFIDLNQTGALVGKEGSTVPTMVDSLTFTTKISMNLTPKITINSPGNRLTDAEVKSENYREDKHEVVISFSLPVAVAPSSAAAKPATKTGKSGIDPTKQRALDAIDEFRTLEGYTTMKEIRRRLDVR